MMPQHRRGLTPSPRNTSPSGASRRGGFGAATPSSPSGNNNIAVKLLAILDRHPNPPRAFTTKILLAVVAACFAYNVIETSPSILRFQQELLQMQVLQQQQQRQTLPSTTRTSPPGAETAIGNAKRDGQQQATAAAAQQQAREDRTVPSSSSFPAADPPRPPSPRRVEFIDPNDLDVQDLFAASWWQSTERFLQANLTNIQNVEGDAFIPIRRAGNGDSDARMAVDWLDFSVEHLSKWWKMLMDDGQSGVNYAIGKLQAYTLAASHHRRRRREDNRNPGMMESTLAVVPYGVRSDPEIWETALTATLASLIKQGVGRIVVVGYYELDETLARSAFENLGQYYEVGRKVQTEEGKDHYFSMEAASTEMVFVHTDNVRSFYDSVNVPKGALVGVQEALKGNRTDASDWVGENPSKWRYIYLTEADQILNARLSHDFFDAMDRGGIVIPHRLQPIPHWLDLQTIIPNRKGRRMTFVPRDIAGTVVQLDPGTDSCCDEGFKSRLRLPEAKTCSSFWWQCGLVDGHGNAGNLDHLRNYSFVRVSTGVVHLATTEHSRKCRPARGPGGCQQKPRSSAKSYD